MPFTAIICGTLLTLIGAIGYVYGLTIEKASVTALIPTFFGIALFILGLLAQSKENLRKHLMHAAVLIALVGFIMTAGRLLMKIADISMSPAVISQVAMAVVCLAFVILAIRSFAAARKAREG